VDWLGYFKIKSVFILQVCKAKGKADAKHTAKYKPNEIARTNRVRLKKI